MKKMQKVIPATILFLSLLSGFSFGFQYPEFTFGKKTIEETSVATSYGTLKSSFISSGDKYYVLWELRGGGKNYSLLLSLSESEEWSMRIGEDVAVLPVSEEEVACMMMGETIAKAAFPGFKILRLSAKEALEKAPEHWFHYDMLYLMLSGEVHPVVKKKLSSHAQITAQFEDDCEKIKWMCLEEANISYDECRARCLRDIPEGKEQQGCIRDCTKAYMAWRRWCFEEYLKCIGRQ
jgi:hypothetical protein